jgi:hypothetical protein
MSSARLKWIALIAACILTLYGATHFHRDSVREYLTSAQVYWQSDQAVITITTAAELRSEGLVSKALCIARRWVNLPESGPDLRVGAAHVFTLQNGSWQEQKLEPRLSPQAFPLWPYNGSFYTWDNFQPPREWNGHALLPVPPQCAADLQTAFPEDPDNFLPAGTGVSPRPYDVVQDVITRDEWHAYRNIASLPEGKHLPFPANGKVFDLFIQRGHVANSIGEVSLTISESGKPLPLWQAQPLPQIVSAAEFAQYLNAPPLSPLRKPAPLTAVPPRT